MVYRRLVLAVALSFGACLYPDTISVGTYDFMPLVGTEYGAPAGVFVDVIRQIARERAWTLEFRHATWDDSLSSLKSGKLDILLCVGVNEERKAFLDYASSSVFVDAGVIYGRRDNDIVQPFDLNGKGVGCLKGSIYTEGFRAFAAGFELGTELVEFDSYDEVARAISDGSVDAGIMTHLIGKELSRKYGLEGTPIFFSPKAITFAFRKGLDPAMRKAVDESLRKMKSDSSSAYHRSVEGWLKAEEAARVPAELLGALGVLLAFALASTLALAFARWEIARKTARLTSANRQLILAQRAAGMGSWSWNTKTGLLSWSDQMYVLFGVDPSNKQLDLQEVIRRSIHPEDRAKVDESNASVVSQGTPIPLEYRIVRPDGSVRVVWAEASEADRDGMGNIAVLNGYVQDITERRAEEQRLKALVEEKEVLLRELYHRTKNNLFTVSSMLELFGERPEYAAAREAFADMRTRIEALALVHSALYRSKNLGNVDMLGQLASICENLKSAFNVADRIAWLCDAAVPCPVPVDVAIPLSIVANELLMNSFKYAFPAGRRGTIRFSCVKTPEGYEMIISDDGIGMKETGVGGQAGLGLVLVASIVGDQLKGSIETERGSGSCFRIRIPGTREGAE